MLRHRSFSVIARIAPKNEAATEGAGIGGLKCQYWHAVLSGSWTVDLNHWPLIHVPAKDGLDKFPKGVGVFLDNFQGLIFA